jgi:hypothetical protein
MTKLEENFLAWIRRHDCVICGRRDWTDERGDPRVDPSHVVTKGSAKAHGQEEVHIGNCLPMCHSCHERFEATDPRERRTFLRIADKYKERWEASCATNTERTKGA